MIYDVGGARTSVRVLPFCLAFGLPVYQRRPFRSFDASTDPSLQRAAWYPYFDDCDAIIFLAPVSSFDERLSEDRRVNRLEDSFMLWRAVAASKLLARTAIVLFLNKCDLLERKLRAGVRVRDFVHSYGDRPNDVEHAVKCAYWSAGWWGGGALTRCL